MISRMVQPEELDRTEELFCIAFEFKKGDDPILAPDEKERFASFNEDGDMMAFLCSPPEEVYFDDNKVQMSCIGAVSTLPHYRKGGALKGAFIKSLDYAYETGVTLSGLYPFSSAYYRRFGYEYVIDKAYYKISLAAIKPFELTGQFYLNENGSELPAIKEVYRSFAHKYNFMFSRHGVKYFKSFSENLPHKDGLYTYIYKTDDGETPKAVLSFEKISVNDGFNMKCKAFWYTCDEGLQALLTFAKGFETYYKQMEIELPIDVDMHNYIAEWALYPMEKTVASVCMMRVINVKQTLMAAKYIGSGEAVLDISDNILKQNNGVYHIIFKNGKAVSCELTQKAPCAKLTMPVFTKCILGAQSADALLKSGQAEIIDIQPLRQMFYQKSNYIANAF